MRAAMARNHIVAANLGCEYGEFDGWVWVPGLYYARGDRNVVNLSGACCGTYIAPAGHCSTCGRSVRRDVMCTLAWVDPFQPMPQYERTELVAARGDLADEVACGHLTFEAAYGQGCGITMPLSKVAARIDEYLDAD